MKYLKIAYLFLLTLSSNLLLGQTTTVDVSQLDKEIPIDPTVKTGILSNGLTYYIKQNSRTKDKAELRLVVNAGSILEDEDQLGLAHFVEHMAFNGTESFKKNELINYLQNLGVEFGADLNAHTGFDETVYKLSVPTNDEAIFDTSLKVLREWADGITFDDEEIDNERGVVAEELRARSGAGMRMYYQSIPVITNNSRYAKRSPIGTLDVILNSKYDAMKRFYRDWYRPDLMALVLVGDFDVDETEEKIKKAFQSIAPVKKAKERVYYTIPENKEPAITVITDKEARGVSISIYHKKEKEEIVTLKDYKQKLLQKMYTGMLRQRLTEVELLPDAPFLSASAGIGKFLSNQDCYYLRATLKEDKVKHGIKALLLENERAKKYGFTTSELERYKALLLNNANLYKKETGKLPTKYYVEQFIDNFTDATPIPGEEFVYNFYKNVLPSITVDEVNKISQEWIRDNNIAVVVNAIEKAELNLPSKKDVLEMLSSSTTQEIAPYKDSFVAKELMSEKPKEGKLLSTKYNANIDVTTWEFANGVTVMVKPTKFQNDLISMSGFRSGGSSVVPDSLYVSARYAGNIIKNSGINSISNTDLQKLNMGKTVKVTPYINYYDDLFSASSTSADLETMLQMIHLYFTVPNKDVDVFNAFKEQLKSSSKDQDTSPGAFFQKKKSEIMSQNHLRAIPLTEKQIEEELDLDEAYSFYKNHFSSANGFTFIFVGSLDVAIMKQYATQYLGGLPSNLKEKISWRDTGLRRPKGVIKKTYIKGMDDKSSVTINFSGDLDFSIEKKEQISLLGKLLKIKLTEELREKMSGVYGVRVSGFASNKPNDWYRLSIDFTCAPENVKKLTDKVYEEIEKIKKNGASEIDIHKIKEAELSNAKDYLKINGYWTSKLKTAHEYHLNKDEILDYESGIDKINSAYFQEAAKTYFDEENIVELILMPEKTE